MTSTSTIPSSADEIVQKSAGVTSYMNNGHKESLAYLVTHHADLLKPLSPDQVEMVSIDAKKVTLDYTPAKDQPKKRIEVPFYPFLRSYDEVRPRFVELCQTSERVVKNRKPVVAYKAPKFSFFVLALLLALYAVLRSDSAAALVPVRYASEWQQTRELLGGRQAMDRFMATCVKVHVAEALVMASYAALKGASKLTAAKWGLTQLFLGFPTLFEFWKQNSAEKMQRRAVFGVGAEKRKAHH
ncbi:hypothetical protein ACQY0O_003401 [Thecaphora frezii]